MRSFAVAPAAAVSPALVCAIQSPASASAPRIPLALSDVHEVQYDAPRNRILITGDVVLVAVDATSGIEVERLSRPLGGRASQ